ncbi:MAG: SixA phosphatase family protein [Kiritimatiellia bacterium]
MKILMLLRHAKAVPEHAGGDFTRPLAPRGIQQMQQVAAAFQAQNWKPQLTLVSAATRTLQTARLLEANLGDLNIISDRVLYLAAACQLLDVLAATPPEIERLMLVGHNPGISDLAARLTGNLEHSDLPTAGFMTCQLDIPDWQSIQHL